MATDRHPLEGLAYALGVLGGQALHTWLRDVHFTTLQGGSRLIALFPPGICRTPADAGRCLVICEDVGLIVRVGYDSSPSLQAFKRMSYGRHPSKREPFVEAEERCYGPGPRADWLAVLANAPWEELSRL